MISTEMVDAAAKHLVRIDVDAEREAYENGLSANDIRELAWAEQPKMIQHVMREVALNMLNAAVAVMGTDLQGATNGGAEDAWPQTAGEFAFRWNTQNEDERELYSAAIVGMAVDGNKDTAKLADVRKALVERTEDADDDVLERVRAVLS